MELLLDMALKSKQNKVQGKTGQHPHYKVHPRQNPLIIVLILIQTGLTVLRFYKGYNQFKP